MSGHSFSSPALQKLLQTAVQAAQAAGEIHNIYRDQPLEIRSKTHTADLVTQVDLQAQAAIQAVIGHSYPHHTLLGEESSSQDQEALAPLETASCWIVDPLDGTQNYACGLPLSCVSVAYIEWGQPLVGVILNPLTNELFTAVRRGGAFLNDVPLQVSRRATLETPALLGTGFPRDIAQRPQLLRPFLHLTARGLPVRRLGCSALSLAFLAAGRTDGYWDTKLSAWDVAAGLLLVREAGGQVTDMDGGAYRWNGSLVASNDLIHTELLSITRLAFETAQ